MPEARHPQRQLVRGLRLWDATAIVAGSMIGSGVFIVSADIARQVGAPAWLLAVWGITGVMTVAGALSYGELAAMMPHAGGQYVYLREAYGPLVGFLYGWTLFLVIQTGTIAAVAVAFAKFTAVMFPGLDGVLRVAAVPIRGQQVVALAVILVLTAVNCSGLRTARFLQNLFTLTKVGALVALVGCGLLMTWNSGAATANASRFWAPPPFSASMLPVFGAAMVGALFSSDAWNNITFAAGEVENPARVVPASLGIGTVLVTLLYLAANVVYLTALPIDGHPDGTTPLERGIAHAAGDRVGTAATEVMLGPPGTAVMAAAIMVSTFGCLNGLILAGARVYFAMANDRLFFRFAAFLNTRAVPAAALIMQGAWACALTLSGTYGDLLDYVIFAALLFLSLTVAALFVLRRTRPDAPRPYRAIGYPLLPAGYVVAASLVMLDLLVLKPRYTWPGLLIVVSGVPVYRFWNRAPDGA